MSKNSLIPIESEDASASFSASDLPDATTTSDSSRHNDFEGSPSDDIMEDVEVGGDPKETVITEVVEGTVVDVPGTMNKGVRAGFVRKLIVVACIVVALLVIIISLAVALPNNETSSSSAAVGSSPISPSPPVPSPVSSPVASTELSPVASPVSAPTPTEPRKTTFDEVVNFLSQMGVSKIEDLRNRESAQHGAAVFMANHDPQNLPLPQATSLSDPTVEPFVTRYIMTMLHHALDGYNWSTQVNFMSSIETCFWHGTSLAFTGGPFPGVETGGFFCQNGTRLPIALDLEYNNMRGQIPTELGLLTTMIFLDLEFNFLNGTIPTELCQLTNLQYLSLRGNELTGSIPSCMGQWTDLNALYLELNLLTGSFPQGEALCNMTEMDTLVIQRNLLTGSLPTCLGQWSKLNSVFASENFFEGEIPQEIQALPNLTNFLVDNNELSGDPTALFSSMSNLTFLYLDNNTFMGVIDSTFMANAPNLVVLDLSHNGFTLDSTTQSFPLHLLQHPTLQILDISENRLEGSLPSTELQPNDQLVFLSVHANNMTGSIPRELRRFSQLLHLDLSRNTFTGPLPDQLFSMTLQNLFLSENPTLQPGPLPDTVLRNHTGFREISLRNTQRTGPLPSFTNFSALELLDLGSNDFSGEIPTQYSQLPMLRYLLLNRNPRLSGSIPVMSQSSFLQVVLLDDTDIFGDFSSICSLAAFNANNPLGMTGGDALVVNCNTTAGEVSNCACCMCCPVSAGGCSDPVVANLDWTWENELSRNVRDFAVNETLLIDIGL